MTIKVTPSLVILDIGQNYIVVIANALSRLIRNKIIINSTVRRNRSSRHIDYKKAGIDASLLDAWIARIGWEPLLNRRGMTWRKLNDGIKANIDLDSARTLMLENPSIIRRPVLDNGDKLTVGFTEENYRALFRE